MGMKKVYYGPEGIMLSHIMRLYDKESLLHYASELQIRRTSRLKKDELAEKIANELLAPSVMRRRIAVFSPEQRALLERAMKEPFVPVYEEMEDALQLNESDYAFLDKQDQLNVPVDVKQAYEKLNTPEFQKYAQNMSWLAQCLGFAEEFYGVFDKEILWKVFCARKGFHISYEELERLCDEFPDDMTICRLEKGQRIIVAEYLFFDEQYKDLLYIQAEKDFYIPRYQEVLDYDRNLYLSEEPAYEKLRSFFQSEMKMTYREADDETAEIWEEIQDNVDFPDIVQCIIDAHEEILDNRKLEKLLQLLQDANNHTRLQIHRGHTPDEMAKKYIEQGKVTKNPVVVPGSTDAAKLLEGASAELKAMGIKVDFDSNATIVQENDLSNPLSGKADGSSKKVYPNDPCPCGSGKKFKKCCGR